MEFELLNSEWLAPAITGGAALFATLLAIEERISWSLRKLLQFAAALNLAVAISTGGENLSRLLAA